MANSRSRVVAAVLATVAILLCAGGPPPAHAITLTFVRHAQSAGNASGLIDTAVPGPGLTPLGQEQADKVAAALRDRYFDGMYASDMVRTQQTAAPLQADLAEPVDVLPGLREIEAGNYEGTPEANAATGYFQAPARWLAGDRDARIPGSIDGNEFEARFSDAVRQIYDSGEQNPVAFAHGASISLWTMMNVTNPDPALVAPSAAQHGCRGAARQPGGWVEAGQLGRCRGRTVTMAVDPPMGLSQVSEVPMLHA